MVDVNTVSVVERCTVKEEEEWIVDMIK